MARKRLLATQQACPYEYLGCWNGIHYYLARNCDTGADIVTMDTRTHDCPVECPCTDPILIDDTSTIRMGSVARTVSDGKTTKQLKENGLDRFVPSSSAVEGYSHVRAGRFFRAQNVEFVRNKDRRVNIRVQTGAGAKDEVFRLLDLNIVNDAGTVRETVRIGQQLAQGTGSPYDSGTTHSHKLRVGTETDYYLVLRTFVRG